MNAPINADFRPVAGIEPLAGAAAQGSGVAEAQPAGFAFADALADAVARVDAFRVQADNSVNGFLNGTNEEIHRVAVAAQQAELSFDLFLQVKNKVVQAYQEVMRMQL